MDIIHRLVKDKKKEDTYYKLTPSIVANVVSLQPPQLQPTPWLSKTPVVDTTVGDKKPVVDKMPVVDTAVVDKMPDGDTPDGCTPVVDKEAVVDMPDGGTPVVDMPDGGTKRKRYNHKGERTIGDRPKMTRGQENRNRQGPMRKKEVLQFLEELQEKHGNYKHARQDGKALIEHVAQTQRVPLSNLRKWSSPKASKKIYKDAGKVEASMIMGVKQRKFATKIKNMLREQEPSMVPLYGHMKIEPLLNKCFYVLRISVFRKPL